MKATLFLRKDHETIRDLFEEYQQTRSSSQNGKRAVFERIRKELLLHSQIKIELFFPELEAVSVTEDGEKRIKASLQEERQIRKVLTDISANENDKQFESKVAGLVETVNRHIDDEEELIDEIRRGVSEQRLEELGLEMEERKRMLTLIAA